MRLKLTKKIFLDKAGFTLIEMLVVVSVFVLVFIATSEIFITVSKVSRNMEISEEVNRDIQQVVGTISREARKSKTLQIYSNSDPLPGPNKIVITNVNDTQIIFDYDLANKAIRVTNGANPVQNLSSSKNNVNKFEISDTSITEGNASNIQPFFILTVEIESKQADLSGVKSKVNQTINISKRNYYSQTFNQGTSSLTDIFSVITGREDSYAIKSDGSFWVTGNNFYGELGLGNTSQVLSWTQVSSATLNNIIDSCSMITSSENAALVLKSDGTLHGAGRNYYGELGLNDTNQRNSWTSISTVNSISNIACGGTYSLVLKSDGTVWGVGDNSFGKLGIGDTFPTNNILSWSQAKTNSATNLTDIIAIAAGGGHSLALSSTGEVYATGTNSYYQHGDNNLATKYYWTKATLTDIVAISAGSNYSLALKSDGTVYVAGANSSGQLGLAPNARNIWTLIPQATLNNAIKVVAGVESSFVIRADGTVYATGENSRSELGVNNGRVDLSVWTQIPSLNNVSSISSSLNFSLALKKDGTVWGAGMNSQGKFGISSPDTYFDPWRKLSP